MATSNGETEHIYYENEDHEELGNHEIYATQEPQENPESLSTMQEPEEHAPQEQETQGDHEGQGNRHGQQSSPREVQTDTQERRKNEDPDQSMSTSVGCTLYVRNLPTHFQSEQVRAYFNRYGEVVDCRIVINPVTKESRGFGFVTYQSVEIADNAMSQMDQTEVDGRILRVEKARRNKPHDPTPGEYKGPTGASIKYDNRGRLRPGYVPYWDLPPPRATDRWRSGGGKHHDYYDHHHRSRSDPRHPRYSQGRESGHRGRSPSSHHYYGHHRSGQGASYYYSPSPGSRDHAPPAKSMRYYYDDYAVRRRYHGNDDMNSRGSSYRHHEGNVHHDGSVHRDSASPPRRGGVVNHAWDHSGSRHHHHHTYSPPPPQYRSSHASDERQRHTRHHHEGGGYRNARRGDYFSGGADTAGSVSPRGRPTVAGANVSSTRASPPGMGLYYNRNAPTSVSDRHH